MRACWCDVKCVCASARGVYNVFKLPHITQTFAIAIAKAGQALHAYTSHTLPHTHKHSSLSMHVSAVYIHTHCILHMCICMQCTTYVHASCFACTRFSIRLCALNFESMCKRAFVGHHSVCLCSTSTWTHISSPRFVCVCLCGPYIVHRWVNWWLRRLRPVRLHHTKNNISYRGRARRCKKAIAIGLFICTWIIFYLCLWQ